MLQAASSLASALTATAAAGTDRSAAIYRRARRSDGSGRADGEGRDREGVMRETRRLLAPRRSAAARRRGDGQWPAVHAGSMMRRRLPDEAAWGVM